MELITKEEYEDWSQHPVTRKVLKQLEDKILFLKTDFSIGKTLDEDSFAHTTILTAKAVGKIEGINEIFKIDVE